MVIKLLILAFISWVTVMVGFLVGVKWGLPIFHKWNWADRMATGLILLGTLGWMGSIGGLAITIIMAIF